MLKPTISWLRKLDRSEGPGMSFEELERLVGKHVESFFQNNSQPEKWRHPMYGQAYYTVFNLQTPIRKWLKALESEGTSWLSGQEKRELLGRFIFKYLGRQPTLGYRKRPLNIIRQNALTEGAEDA